MGLYFRSDRSYTLWDSTTAYMEVTHYGTLLPPIWKLHTMGLYFRRDGSYTLWDSTSAMIEVTHYGTLLPP